MAQLKPGLRDAVRRAPERELDNAAVELAPSAADSDEPRFGALFQQGVD